MKIKDIWWEIRYYAYQVPRDWYYNIKHFIENLVFFRKELWRYRNWDFTYNLELFIRSLEGLANQIENGHEEERSAQKKVAKIRELIELLNLVINEYGLDNCFNSKLYLDVRGATLNKIHKILKGQTNLPSRANYEEWVEQFDGSGLEGWWE